MRIALLVGTLIAVARPLAAQQRDRLQTPAGAVVGDAAKLTRADTAAILRAATDSVWRFIGGNAIVVADTAWVPVVRTSAAYRRDTTGASDETAAAFTNETRRVERRKGQWVRMP